MVIHLKHLPEYAFVMIALLIMVPAINLRNIH